MRFSSLASSSKAGSAYLIEGGDGTRVLVDCGLGIRRLEARLWESGANPASVSGVFLTHGHSDHVAAVRLRRPFTRKFHVPLYASRSLLASLADGVAVGPAGDTGAGAPEGGPFASGLGEAHPLRAATPVQVGGLEVTPFLKPHDADDPFGFVLTDGESRLAVVTDLGCVSREIVRLLRGSTFLVFESNHDVDMELNSGRPAHLIRRVLGDRGHLSNEQAGEALAEIAGPETRMVVLAHLSDECNTPELALSTVSRYLDEAGYGGGLAVAPMFQRSCQFSESHTPRLQAEALGR